MMNHKSTLIVIYWAKW